MFELSAKQLVEGFIEIDTRPREWVFRPMCQCSWVGLSTSHVKDAAIHYRQHVEEAHA